MGKLSDLPNISNVLENELIEVGIHSPEELQAIGTENAFIRIMAINETACTNKLYAIEGAIQSVRWHNLPADRKAELREFFRMKKIQ